MKKITLIVLAIALSFCFGFFIKTIITKQPDTSIDAKQPDNDIQMKKVTGIGGIFFKCKDPDKIKEWYKTHLGFDTDQFGARFEWQVNVTLTCLLFPEIYLPLTLQRIRYEDFSYPVCFSPQKLS